MSTPNQPDNKNPQDGAHKPRSHKFVLLILIAVFAILGGWGVISRMKDEKDLKNKTEETALAAVTVMEAKAGPDSEDVVLPGNVQAWHEAPIYARTNGYLKSWSTDIGAHVKAGEVLAEIDTPDVDAQMHQAEANLSTAIANNELAQTTMRRWLALLKTNSVSKQEADEKIGAAAANEAMVASAKANLDRLRQLEDYRLVIAPFDGVITARNTDLGALINSGSGSGSGQELFHIAETDKLRVYVQVPENYTASVKPDMKVDLYFPAYPQHAFPAILARTADAIDPVTRTLLIQLQVDNADSAFLSGGYAEVHIKLLPSGNNVRLPVNTLLFRDGMQVATIDDQGRAVLKTITIGRDYGKSVEVLAGVTAGETIIVNPPDDLANGEQVHVVKPEEADKNGNKKTDDKDNKNKEGKKDDAGIQRENLTVKNNGKDDSQKNIDARDANGNQTPNDAQENGKETAKDKEKKDSGK